MSFEPLRLPLYPKYLNPLVFDYLQEKTHISNFYSHHVNENGFKSILNVAQKYKWDRQSLINILLNQSQNTDNTSEITFQNIHLLAQDNTYTITTGHQLCLFTGPLYFIYKIAGTIQLSKQLKQIFPDYNFVPIFWMATEDHDIEEINHFYFKDKIFTWNVQNNETPVFLLQTRGLDSVLNEMKESTFFSEDQLNLFRSAYLKHTSYVDATRYLVNELFGKEGIVVINPNERTFKENFQGIFYKDIFENTIYHSVTTTTNALKQLKYKIQANPREINTFLLYKNKRYLIQKNENKYTLKNTDIHFSTTDLEKLLNTHPESFSPNVLMRPLYQQKILPNIAYIGGSAEIAYWLELKHAFDVHNVFYPLIIQRPIIFLLPNNIQQKINKLDIDINTIFTQEKDRTIKQILDKQQLNIHFDEEKQHIIQLFKKIEKQTENIDKSLLPFVNGELTALLKYMNTLEHKLNKSIKQKNENILKQTADIYSNFFPEQSMQDRRWNISYGSKISGYTSVQQFVNAILPYCNISINNNYQITILKIS